MIILKDENGQEFEVIAILADGTTRKDISAIHNDQVSFEGRSFLYPSRGDVKLIIKQKENNVKDY